eukprot:CAMPEP_0185025358 /NCGR_PEP_ID=MMETSP1103-20130426/8350_1 /TAXON_ID=36769 /ORGANISM="Paraphysomonas bandaiensis, Strain Caron Lab Isolate" /LENGTH=191 /DNA_ID=CAMNT_0027558547 /DNA_START=67 /DNA_END=642 /DNA_ORIENTATION=-
MDISPEERVNMSLDDLIKAKRKTNKTKAKKTIGEKKGVKKNGSTAAERSSKAADKSVGQAKAKRAAAANKRRGLNATGKATKAEISKAVTNQQAKTAKRVQNKVKTAGIKAKAAKKAPALPKGGLKISFKPAELSKTTDKKVAAQIIGALSKDPNYNKGNRSAPKPAANQGGRKVQVQAPRPAKKQIRIRK